MAEPKMVHKTRNQQHTRKRNPYLYLGLGAGLLVAAVMVIATAGVLVAGLPFVISAGAVLGVGINALRPQRGTTRQPRDCERELLWAIRDSGGEITPAQAAMETPLTVREADAMLSELAAGGHLAVESRDGALFYSLAGRGDPSLELPER